MSASRLQKNYCGTVEIQWSARPGQQENTLAGCSKWHPSKAAGSSATEAYFFFTRPPRAARTAPSPGGTLQGDGRLRTTLGDIFSILLSAMSIGRRNGLLEDRAEAEVGNGIFEVGVQPFEGSHVRVSDVFHR